MMRIVFHNPHTNIALAKTLFFYILKLNGYKKYKYLLDFLIKKHKKIYVYIDYKNSSLPPWLSNIIPDKIEVYLWALINNINPLKMVIISSINELTNNDIFFSFSLKNLDKEYHGIDNIIDKKFLKILHLTHFALNTSIIEKNIKKYNIDFLVAENNLKKNSPYFRKYFPFYNKDVYLLPFAFQKRFKKIKPFNERINKCFAIGTLINLQEIEEPETFNDFNNFFKTTILQPERAMIHKNKEYLKKYIDSSIREYVEKKSKKNNNKNIVKLLITKFYNAFFASKRSYLKFNIVEKYNGYRMFINGKELNDLPGIGFVEGMACGCAYIGRVDPMFIDIGLKPGMHYIGYDGTLQDLKKKIKYYQEHPKKLEKIANNGYEFATKNFNSEIVAEKFYRDLQKLINNYKNNGYNKTNIKFKSSFIVN